MVAGDKWHTEGSLFDGLTLTDGETITFRDTISGATGNNGNLEFDNFQISSTVVPEPSAPALASSGRFRRTRRISTQASVIAWLNVLPKNIWFNKLCLYSDFTPPQCRQHQRHHIVAISFFR